MLEVFGGSDNPPTAAIRAWCAPTTALFDGRSLHGYKVGASRHCLSLSLCSLANTSPPASRLISLVSYPVDNSHLGRLPRMFLNE